MRSFQTELELDNATLLIEYSWDNPKFTHAFGVHTPDLQAVLEDFTLTVHAANLDIDVTLSLTDSQRSYIKGLALDYLQSLEADTDSEDLFARDPMDRDDD